MMAGSLAMLFAVKISPDMFGYSHTLPPRKLSAVTGRLDLLAESPVSEPPVPPEPPDPPDLAFFFARVWSRASSPSLACFNFSFSSSHRLTTTASFNTVVGNPNMVSSCFITSNSDGSWNVDERVGLVLFNSTCSGLFHSVWVPFGSVIVHFARIFVTAMRPLTAVCRLSPFPVSLGLIVGISPLLFWSGMGKSQPLPRIEVITSVVIASLFETSFAFVRLPTAICRLCSLALGAMKFFSLFLWQVKRNNMVYAIFPVNLDCVGTYCCAVENVFSPMFPFLLNGLVAARFESKTTIASVLLFEGSVSQCSSALVAKIMTDYSALVAVSVSDIVSPSVFFVSGIVSPLNNIVGNLFDGFCCASVWTASILFFYALWFAFVVVYWLALMALVSCFVNNFSLDGE